MLAPAPFLPAGQSWHVALPFTEVFPLAQLEQPWPLLLDLVLAAHLAQRAVPAAALKVPGMQAMHDVWPVVLWYVPAPQSVHTVTSAAEIRPTAHFSQVRLPTLPLMYLPAAHAVQFFELAAGATVPAGQDVGAVEPARHMLPAGQGWQPDWEGRPDSLP